MTITDLISDGSNNISITVGISDLKEFGLSLIEEGRAMGRAERGQETYLTPDEVAKMLGVPRARCGGGTNQAISVISSVDENLFTKSQI